MAHEPEIADLINAKRASGYDGAFEALLRQPWYCPHCKASKTILNVMVPMPNAAIRYEACGDCDKVGIKHLADRGMEQLSKLLDCLAPFNRSGTA